VTATGATQPPLSDAQGRRITYLRLSLTDRCNFRCSYCNPHGLGWSGGTPLTRPEIRQLATAFARIGVRRVRLTGGEPTLRRDLPDVVGDLLAVHGIEEVALTTNGQLLEEQAARLREVGLARLNVSLDTLDPDRMARLAGPAADLERIRRGFAAAARAGFASLKLNAVVLRGENEAELGDLARFAWRHGAVARFIELMPFGGGVAVPVPEMERLLASQGIHLEPDATRGWGPARHMRGSGVDGDRPVSGLVGFIGAFSENFCADCNRVRVAADGTLRACLGGREEVALGEVLRAGASLEDLEARIREAVSRKSERHDLGAGPLPPMVAVGG